jgi:hypothetical protein
MQRCFFVPLLALGVAFSGSALGQVSTRSNVTKPQSQAKMHSPNNQKQQRTHAPASQKQATSSQLSLVTGPILATPRGPVNMDAGD